MSVNVPDQVRNIFEKYRDKSGKKVFEFYTHYSSADTMSYNINKALKFIGKKIGAIDLEMYAARHTFASLARNECGFSIDKVAQALNNVESEHKVTDLYIKKDWSTIDQVQEKVLELFDWTALS